MNERIKAIAEEAGFHPAHPMSGLNPADFFPPANMNSECSRELKKFAELIVRECAEVSFKHWEQHKECSAHFSIREHFGVAR